MRHILVIACLACLFTGTAVGQLQRAQLDRSRIPAPPPHFQPEYTFDTPTDPLRWTREPAGLHVSFASTDESYMRSEVPDLSRETPVWEATGWKGERLNAQLLIWSPDTVRQIRVGTHDLVAPTGSALGKRHLRVDLVRYVVSNYPYGATDVSCGATDTNPTYLMPDRLEPLDRFDLPGKTVRPIWLSLDIPPDAKPGVYQGTLDVSSENSRAQLQVKIRVQNQTLPNPRDWKFRLDLWQNPWVVAWYYHVEPWSDEHKALLKRHLRLYADAGGKYITTYAVHSPWSDNSYMIEGGMIEWIKRVDGTWEFDYRIFDQYVQLAMDAGVTKAITVYTPLPWGDRFRYLDEKSGNYVYEEWPPASAQFTAAWNAFLTDLKGHLVSKGWFARTYLGINENPLEHTLAAATLIKAHSKQWKITYAGNWHPELDSLLDDYSPIITSEPSLQEVKARAARGSTTTYYVCCTPQKPNTFVFSPPIEGRYISWYSAAHGYDGFLRWAYDAWPADPVRDARHTAWPAGDEFLVYPGANSSVRFEKLREGIVDYEKIRIIRALASKSADPSIQREMKAFETHLASFVGDSDYGKRDYDQKRITDAVHTGQQLLEALSDRLAR
jgi:glycosyl hydrolase family 123